MFKIKTKKKYKQRFEDGADDSAFVDTAAVATMAAFLGSRKLSKKKKPGPKKRKYTPKKKKPGPKKRKYTSKKKKSGPKRGGSKKKNKTRRR